ncbi:hypothetical protein CPC08DRAFT_606467, partial [Agrocybe pediades]
WEATHPPPNLLITMDPKIKEDWIKGYASDPHFKAIWSNPEFERAKWKPGYRYFKEEDGLLFFRDEDFHPRLCVPEVYKRKLLIQAHEAPVEGAHSG